MQIPQILDHPRSQITPFRQKCPLYSGGGEQPQVERCKPLAKMMGNHLDTMDDTNVCVDDNSKLQLQTLYGLPSLSSMVYFERLFYCESLHTGCNYIYGFSPVWVLGCISRLLFIVKGSSHWLDLYGFCKIWVSWYYLNEPIEIIKIIKKYII